MVGEVVDRIPEIGEVIIDRNTSTCYVVLGFNNLNTVKALKVGGNLIVDNVVVDTEVAFKYYTDIIDYLFSRKLLANSFLVTFGISITRLTNTVVEGKVTGGIGVVEGYRYYDLRKISLWCTKLLLMRPTLEKFIDYNKAVDAERARRKEIRANNAKKRIGVSHEKPSTLVKGGIYKSHDNDRYFLYFGKSDSRFVFIPVWEIYVKDVEDLIKSGGKLRHFYRPKYYKRIPFLDAGMVVERALTREDFSDDTWNYILDYFKMSGITDYSDLLG